MQENECDMCWWIGVNKIRVNKRKKVICKCDTITQFIEVNVVTPLRKKTRLQRTHLINKQTNFLENFNEYWINLILLNATWKCLCNMLLVLCKQKKDVYEWVSVTESIQVDQTGWIHASAKKAQKLII